ncbi:MAG: nucleotidyltransferase family protein [Pseudomonadota bacterium]
MTNAPFPVMMFAAGLGTRMRPLTDQMPKPMIKVVGKPLVDHALDLARDAGCGPVVANLHYLPDALEAHLAPLGVTTVIERPDILETGGGLRNALPVLGRGPVVTLNTDAVWKGPNPVSLLMEGWNPDKMDALLMCVPPTHAIGHLGKGDFIIEPSGRLTRGTGAIYCGVQIIKTELLETINEPAFSLNVIWDQMLLTRRLFGLCYPGKWCDVGRPEGIARAEALLKDCHV